jgi:hypothetical protein
MKCSLCGAEVSPGEMFCGECGHPVQESVAPPTPAHQVSVRTCPKCNSNVDAGKRFCSSCGYDLMAATATTQAAATSPVVAAAPPVAARTSSSSFRIALIVGLVAVVATFLLTVAGVGLWMWLGRGSQEANQNTAPPATTAGTPASAKTGEMNVSIAGTWNCEIRSPEGTLNGPMVLTQNGSAITGTLANEEGENQIAGTFDGQKFAIRFPAGVLQLALSPDGSTMKGEAQEEGKNLTILCSR